MSDQNSNIPDTELPSLTLDDVVAPVVEQVTNFTLFAPPVVLTDAHKDNGYPELYFPGASLANANEALLTADNIQPDSDAVLLEWSAAVNGSKELYPFEKFMDDAAEDKNADYRQGTDFNGNLYSPGPPPIKFDPNNLRGEFATMHAQRFISKGAFHTFQLPTSCLWLTLKPGTEMELLDLYEAARSKDYTLGRYTYGYFYSAVSALRVEEYVKYALDHIVNKTIRFDGEGKDLLDMIDISDLNTLLWGVLCTRYPKGYKIEIPCTANPSKCNHVQKATLDLRWMQMIDNTKLPSEVRAFITNRGDKAMPVETVTRMSDQVKTGMRKEVVIDVGDGDAITFVLGTCTLREYFSQSHAWVEGIRQSVEDGVVKYAPGKARNDAVTNAARATYLAQYRHMVKEIRYPDGANVQNPDAIASTLAVMSSDDTIRNKLLDAIRAFISTSTVSLIAINNVTCPVCGGKHKTTGPDDYLIPVDIQRFLYQALHIEVSKIALR